MAIEDGVVDGEWSKDRRVRASSRSLVKMMELMMEDDMALKESGYSAWGTTTYSCQLLTWDYAALLCCSGRRLEVRYLLRT